MTIHLPVSKIFPHNAKFTVPLVSSRIALHCNNSYVQAKSHIDEWSVEYIGNTTPEKRAWIVNEKHALNAALSYPQTSLEKLIRIGKITAWEFFADDGIDRIESKGDYVTALVSHHKEILKGTYAGKSCIDDSNLNRRLDMFDRLWKELLATMSNSQQERFTLHMNESFDLALLEYEWTLRKIVPSINEFMELRRKTCAVMTMFVMIEYAWGMDVDKELLQSPQIKRLERIGVDHVMLANDLASFNKEWSDGAYLNIIPIIAYNEKCGLQEALSQAGRMVEDMEQEYVELSEKIMAKPEFANALGVKEYVIGIGSRISGNVEWGWITGRYHSPIPLERSTIFQLKEFSSRL